MGNQVIRKADVTPGDVHVNTPLTNISVAYSQEDQAFVADRVFPIIPVAKQSDVYYTISRAEFNRNEAAIRAPGTPTSGGAYSVDADSSYFCDVYGFHQDIPDQLRGNADSVLSLDAMATEYVTRKIMINKEVNWASTFLTTGWLVDRAGQDSGPTGNQFLQWDDAASTPIEDIRESKKDILAASGYLPNTLVLGYEVFNKLIDHPDIVDRVKYGQTPGSPATIDTSDLAAVLKIPNVMVMWGIYNSADEGATESEAFIGGKKALLCYSAPRPGLMTPSAGYTFTWTGYLGAGANGSRIKRYRRPEEYASDRVEIEAAYDQKVISTDLGVYFYTAVA